jgi:hypothetical protein
MSFIPEVPKQGFKKIFSWLAALFKYSPISPFLSLLMISFNGIESTAFLLIFILAKIGGKKVQGFWNTASKKWKAIFESIFGINEKT